MYAIVLIALVVVVGGGLAVILLAGAMGKSKKRTHRVRYRYSEEAQDLAGNSPTTTTSSSVARRKAADLPTDSREVDELLLRMASPNMASKLIKGDKGVDAAEFGQNIGKAPLKLDRRFLKGPGGESVDEEG